MLTGLFGLVGYATFRDATDANLLSNYADGDGAAVVMRALYVVTMVRRPSALCVVTILSLIHI